MTFYLVAREIVLFIMRFGYKIELVNQDKLPSDKGFILVGNHRSNIDPLFIGLGFKRRVRFMAKEELFKIPVLGFIVKSAGSFPVARGKGDHGAIDKAIEIVQNGEVLGMFPEGSRSKDGLLKRAKSGAVLVASMTGGDIMPVGIKYGEKRFFRRKVTITYGDMIENQKLSINETSKKAELKAASQLIMDRIGALLGDVKNVDIS